MCGRYSLFKLSQFVTQFIYDLRTGDIYMDPRFNVAPGQDAPIVHMQDDGKPGLSMMGWGFIPSWTEGKPKLRPINARAETIATSPMFRSAFERRRCLIPADGFYEPKGAKTVKHRPWYYLRFKDERPFAFAGLWERWKPDPEAEPVTTYTIITTAPNALTASIEHDRSPVIVEPKDYDRWLDHTVKPPGVADILKPHDTKGMEMWPVSDAAKDPRNEGPSLIEQA